MGGGAGIVLDSPIASALRAQTLGHFLIKGFGKLHVDLAYPDTRFLFNFFTVPFAVKEGSGEKVELRAQP